jgi:tripeptidyl-peptidase-1
VNLNHLVTNSGKFGLRIPDQPYVTTVGATKDMNPEIVAYDPRNNFSSGGGFSNYFLRPSYQDSVVPTYIESLEGKFSGLFNTSGRGYPDIAAQGFQFLTIWDGIIVPIDGTRCVENE